MATLRDPLKRMVDVVPGLSGSREKPTRVQDRVDAETHFMARSSYADVQLTIKFVDIWVRPMYVHNYCGARERAERTRSNQGLGNNEGVPIMDHLIFVTSYGPHLCFFAILGITS